MSFIPSIVVSNITYGSITIPDGSSSNTGSVSAGQVPLFLGSNVDPSFSSPVPSVTDSLAAISQSGTTITALRGGTYGDCIVIYAILQINPLFVKSVQNISIAIVPTIAQQDQTVTAVGSKAFLLGGGFYFSATSNFGALFPSIQPTSSTNVRAYRCGTADTTTVKAILVDLH